MPTNTAKNQFESHITATDPAYASKLPAFTNAPNTTHFSPTGPAGETIDLPNLIKYRLYLEIAQSGNAGRAAGNGKRACAEHWEWEFEQVISPNAVREALAPLLDSVGPYLRDSLDDIVTEWIQSSSRRQLRQERENWYKQYLPNKIETAASNASEMVAGTGPQSIFKSVIVVADSTLPDHADTPFHIPTTDARNPYDQSITLVPASECSPNPERRGFTLPQAMLAAKSESSQRLYPFIPIAGTLTCSCGFTERSPVCKHTVAALTHLCGNPHTERNPNDFTVEGPPLHQRFKQFILPATNPTYDRLTAPVAKTHGEYDCDHP